MVLSAISIKGTIKINLKRIKMVSLIFDSKSPINKLIYFPQVSPTLKTPTKRALFQSEFKNSNFLLKAIPGNKKKV